MAAGTSATTLSGTWDTRVVTLLEGHCDASIMGHRINLSTTTQRFLRRLRHITGLVASIFILIMSKLLYIIDIYQYL